MMARGGRRALEWKAPRVGHLSEEAARSDLMRRAWGTSVRGGALELAAPRVGHLSEGAAFR